MCEFKDSKLTAIEGAAGITNNNSASMGSLVLDADKDGQQDLLVAREDGIWLDHNDKRKFTAKKLDAVMPDDQFTSSLLCYPHCL